MFKPGAYRAQVQGKPCIFCRISASSGSDASEYVIFASDEFMAVLDRYPTQVGYVQAFPRAHVETLAALGKSAYLRLHELVYRIADLLPEVVPCERVYTAMLGSAAMTPHLHMHVVPIPPGLPLELQEWTALDKNQGILAPVPQVAGRITEHLRARLG